MLKLAALFATAIAAVQCVLAERVLKVERHVAEIQVSSDPNARLLNLGLNKAMAIDLPTDIKEVLVADSQTVRVVVRTFRRVYIVGAAVGRTNIFFYADDVGRLLRSTFLYRKRRKYHRPNCEMPRSGNK